MELSKLMIDYLAKTLGKSPDSITELLFKKSDDGTLTEEINPDALESLESLHAEHINAAPADMLKAEYDKGHREGKFEALNKAEETLRKTYGIEEKGKLPDLIAAVAAKAAKDVATDDKVLTHPIFLKQKADAEAAIEAVKAEAEAKLTEVTTAAERQRRFATNLSKIETAMAEVGVVLPKTPTAATTLKNAFLKQFEGFDFEETQTGTYLKDASGALVKDKHGHPITVEAYTKNEAANWFDIEKQPQRQSPGNDPGDAPPTKWTKETAPKNAQDFETAYYATTDPAERTALATAFKEAQAAG